MKDLQGLLNKLDTALGKKKNTGNKIDFKELAELKKKSFLKLESGKNNVVFITPEGAEDPFVFWGAHSGIYETPYWSTYCDSFNKNEECVVCKVIDELKSDNYEANKHLWYTIRQQTEYYAPVIVVDSAETIAQGPKWLKLSKTVMSQLTEWLRNLEKDEAEFYSDDEPQKVIINYNKAAAPMEQYKLDKKNYKAFDPQLLKQWRDNLTPISQFFLSKKQEEISKALDEYFARIAEQVKTEEEETPSK